MAFKDMLTSIGGPQILIFIGILAAAIGSLWAAYDQAQFQNLLNQKNETIAGLSERIVNSVTGGDNYPYIRLVTGASHPESMIALLLMDKDLPLYDLTIRVYDYDNPINSSNLQSIVSSNMLYDIGNMPPASARPIAEWSMARYTQKKYNIFFIARNGSYNELLRAKYVNGNWLQAIRVINSKSAIVLENIDEGYPRPVDWK